MSEPPPNVEQMADILKLNIDCCEEIFDYLTKKDLFAVSQTCKRLSKVCGYIFHEKYPELRFKCGGANFFPEFIRNLAIDRSSKREFTDKVGVQSKFHRLETITMIDISITQIDIEAIQESLNKVKQLNFVYCFITSDNLKRFIDLCPQIKCLAVSSTFSRFMTYDWLLHKYPTLESFEFMGPWGEESSKMVPFLKLNPNVRQFKIGAAWLLQHGQFMKNAKITLDYMSIAIDEREYLQFQTICDILNELYSCGVYKRLYLCFNYNCFDEWGAGQLVSLKGLVHIRLSLNEPVSLSNLTDLEEIIDIDRNEIKDLAVLPTKLTNLKRVHFFHARIADLMLFVSQAPRLEKITVRHMIGKKGEDEEDEEDVLDLSAMNKARQALSNGRDLRLTIYIKEKVYLAAKWAKGTECGLIRLQRLDSYEYENYFFYNKF